MARGVAGLLWVAAGGRLAAHPARLPSSMAVGGWAGRKEIAVDEIMRRAEDLGRAIREHSRYNRLLEADAAIRADKEATEALDAYNKAAVEIAKKEEALQPVEPEEKRELDRLMQAVAASETVKSFMKAQTDYAELMRRMNEAIYGQLAPPTSGTGPDQAQNPS